VVVLDCFCGLGLFYFACVSRRLLELEYCGCLVVVLEVEYQFVVGVVL